MKPSSQSFYRLFKTSLISFFVLTMTACSYSPTTLKDTYNNLGKDYARELKQLGDYTPEQRIALDKFGEDLLIWHRKTKLPAYASLTKSLSTKLENSQELSDADLHAYIRLLVSFPNFHEYYKGNVALAKIAQTLSNEQFIQIRERLLEENRDMTEYFQNTSWEKRKREGVYSLRDTFGFLKVELTNKQLDIARKHLNYQQDAKASYISSNESWNNTLLDLLSKRHEKDFIKKFANHMQNDNLHMRLLKSEPVEARHRDQLAVNMFKELIASFSESQRATLIKQLNSISLTMDELIKE